MNRGEVWWVDLPGGPRPYLILTRQAAVPRLERLLAVPVTTTIRGIPTEVPLDRDDGMPNECVLSLDNLDLVARRRFRSRICNLRAEKLQEVCAALSLAVDCS